LRVLGIAALVVLIGFGVFLAATNLWAWYNYSAAEKALQLGDYQRAEKCLDRCLVFWSGNGQVHFWLARTARSLGKYDKAKEHLQKCEELHWSAEGIDLEYALLKAEQGQFTEIEGTLIEWAQKDNEDAAAVLEVLAQVYAKNAQLAQALYWGERFLEHFPNNASALFRIAQIYEVSRNSTASLKYYRRAVETLPDNDKWRQALASALLTFGEPQQALSQFETLRDRGITSKPVLLGLAKCYRETGRKEEAQALVDQLIADGSDDWDVWAERGRLTLPNRYKAEKYFRKAVDLHPYDPITLYNLVLCLRQQDKAKRAEADRLEAKYNQLLEDTKELNMLITQDMSKDPHNPQLVFKIATLLKRLGEEKAAEHWFQKTIELKPTHTGARKALADYYEKIGKKDLAARFR
jgi:tetratricopeptide (TPR) repeat protein